MKKTQGQINKEWFEKKRTQAIKELEKIEKKYGSDLFRSACTRKLTVDRQKKKTQSEIKTKEEELERLKKGKPLPY